MKGHSHLIFLLLSAVLMSSCGHNSSHEEYSSNSGIYYWKTTFTFSKKDSLFLKEAGITRLYLRLFDVDTEGDGYSNKKDVVPVGTLQFHSSVPSNLEIIPTVFITLSALNAYSGNEAALAGLILKRMLAMCSYNEIDGVREFQFDCDWNETSRESYNRLCAAAKEQLHDKDIVLSGTIRLHQVEEAIYPFDKGVLMLYNTGAIKDPNTKNSIISYDDVSKYLSVKSRIEKFKKARKHNCPIVDFAYPTFSWGVCYEEHGQFSGIIKPLEFENFLWLEKKGDRYYVKDSGSYEGMWFNQGQFVRAEYSDISEILKVKDLVEKTIQLDGSSNILFHLDSNNLKHYSKYEISEILH